MTADQDHYRKLERMYHDAPGNAYYAPTLRVEEGRAELAMPVREVFFHSAGAVHGSICFKALDDAAFFAVQSLVKDRFVLTASFSLDLLRPVSQGTLHTVGRVVQRTPKRFCAEAELADDDGRTVARGRGTFVRSRIALGPAVGYGAPGER
ncbi:MAG: PaaI family thioesterase [Planctomycetota bacterium]|jgi:uncharacterized protein (TIGR00369 family)